MSRNEGAGAPGLGLDAQHESEERPHARNMRLVGGRALGRTILALALASALACDDKPAPAPSSAASVVAPINLGARGAPPAAPSASAPVAPAVSKHKDPSSCAKSDPVVFDDATLEAAVRRQLQRPDGPVARADLRRVKTLDLSQAKHNDELDPCVFAYLSGLKSLYLAPGELDDITLLRNTPNLESLRLAATRVADLRPLATLHNLDRLDIGRTPVSDLSPLADLRNLTEVQIDDTNVGDLGPIAKLDKLEVLIMKRTRVKDVSPLRGMKKMKHLYIEGSPVEDVSSLAGLHGLKIHQGP